MRNLLLITLFFSLTLTACKSDKSTKVIPDSNAVATEPGEHQETAGGPLAEKKEVEVAPPTNLYPTIPFGKLDAKKRTVFVRVAQAELCPCPNATVSLDECLKDKKQACDIALAAASVAMKSIQSGMNETDVLDKMTTAVATLKKEHVFNLEGRPFKGAKDAKVKVVEFADFQCPYCKRASDAMGTLAKKYEGKSVAFYYKHFPLSSHPLGFKAAAASVAAMNQGKFWEMHDMIFDHQTSLNEQSFADFAKKLGLNVKKFNKDMNSEKTKEFVLADRKDGENADLKGTPSIYINGQQYINSIDKEDALQQAIDSRLN